MTLTDYQIVIDKIGNTKQNIITIKTLTVNNINHR